MRALDRTLRRVQRIFALGAGAPTPEPTPVPTYPDRRRSSRTVGTAAAIAASIIIPIAFGAALIPLRQHISQSISLLMVLPVLVVALLGGRRLGTLAAIAAAATFDVLHTRPFYRATTDDPDDIVEAVVLLTMGIIIGYLAESAQRAIIAARVRREELTAVTNFLEHIGTADTDQELAEHAGSSILSLLDAEECRWQPRYKGTASPVLEPDGNITSGPLRETGDGGGTLPITIEIPVGHPPGEYGRFIVRTNRRANVSLEERRAAANIATTLARCIGRP